YVDIEKLVRDTVRDIGYTRGKFGFDADTCGVIVSLKEQSADIAMGVDNALEAREGQMTDAQIEAIGAGDQGMMIGFACDETPELMPLPIALSHRLVKQLAKVRHEGRVNFLLPDSKSQVTVRYEDGKPKFVDTVVVSTQHIEDVALKTVSEFVVEEVVRAVVPQEFLTKNTRFFINPTGRFVYGGPEADAGLTGRKIIVDTYGGYSRHGGGAFSGKDPSKVDRSAAYAARYVAKNIVAAGLAERCEIELAYAIGVASPVSMLVDTFGTGKVSESEIERCALESFDFRPKGIIDGLDLLRPIYKPTAAYGHFGRQPGNDGAFSWERTDLVDRFKALL
ncbi:MAG: methionine adenosyltransferase, partial [Bdellovibrionales bacterium]|nr:methionine adenosyltransferase [Bdellovibrionales bacterium]